MLEGRREPRETGTVVRGEMRVAWMAGVAVGRSG